MMKQWVRPILAVIWSVASISIYAATMQSPPEWMLGLTFTSVIWFFSSREIEKRKTEGSKLDL